MGVVFVLEHFIGEPIIIILLQNTKLIRKRGGYFYDSRLGEAFLEVNEL
jgi:hypothetical protein